MRALLTTNKNKYIIIAALAVLAAVLIKFTLGGNHDPLSLNHKKLPAGHPPVYVNSLTFEGENFPVGVQFADGKLLVTYYNLAKVDLFSPGGQKLGSFTTDQDSKPGLPYNMAMGGGKLAITDFVNGRVAFYSLDGTDAELDTVYEHSTAKDKLKPFSIYYAEPYFYVTDQDFKGWLVLDTDGKLVKMVAVKGENKEFKIPGQKEAPKLKPLTSAFGILVTEDKRVIISDPIGAQIKVYDASGKFLYNFEKTTSEKALQYPRGMIMDGLGRVHVVDKKSNNIFVYDNYGKYLFSYAGEKLMGPSTVAVNQKDRAIYISNTEKREISIWGY